MMALASSGVSAQCTWTPFSVRLAFELLEQSGSLRQAVLADVFGQRAQAFQPRDRELGRALADQEIHRAAESSGAGRGRRRPPGPRSGIRWPA
jgi:hypothetical protein